MVASVKELCVSIVVQCKASYISLQLTLLFAPETGAIAGVAGCGSDGGGGGGGGN